MWKNIVRQTWVGWWAVCSYWCRQIWIASGTVCSLWPSRDQTNIYLLLFSSATPSPRARWTELNQNRPHARKWVRFENVCPKSGVSLTLQIGSPKTIFRRLHNLTATFFLTKYTRHNPASALETTLCLENVPTFKPSATSSNLNRFSNFLHCWKAYAICYKTHTTQTILPTSP